MYETRDYTTPALELDRSTLVLVTAGARKEKTYTKNQREVESCSTRTMVYGIMDGPMRNDATQHLQPYDCDASESILIGSG